MTPTIVETFHPSALSESAAVSRVYIVLGKTRSIMIMVVKVGDECALCV